MVRVVAEDFLAGIPAVDDVIDRTGIFEAQLARLEAVRTGTCACTGMVDKCIFRHRTIPLWRFLLIR